VICKECCKKGACNDKCKTSNKGSKVTQVQSLRPSEKQRIKKLLEFRIVKEQLLYVIGLPKSYADAELLKSYHFYGQFGRPEKIVINYNPKKEFKEQSHLSRSYES
jgi:hypothetical protein